MQSQFHTGSLTVDQMSRLHISGNIIPVTWFKTIRKATGKPNLNAIIILADIVYWYRPVEIRDELTGELIGLRKNFIRISCSEAISRLQISLVLRKEMRLMQ